VRRLALVSVSVLLSGLSPLVGHAASQPPKQIAIANPSVTLVQGWWEREHREERARQGYWRLPPEEREHYNRLQGEISQLQRQRHEIDERLNRAEEEQRRILGFERR
jgi:hypothetical protein